MSLWNSMTEVQKVAHSLRHGNQYHSGASPAMLRLAQQHNDERNGGGLGFGHDGSNPTGNTTTTPTSNTGEGVVGSDGLTNRERYDQRRAQEAAQQAAEQERLAALDSNRPEGVSRYIWENMQNGTGFNTTLITRDAAVRDALLNAGHGNYIKSLYESQMDSAASHFMGNGASQQDAFNSAQDPWYTENYGAYYNDSVGGSSSGLGFGHQGGMLSGTSDDNGGGAGGGGAGGGGGVNPPTDRGETTLGQRQSTPFLDAYMKARESSKAEGPVSKTMKKYTE